MGDLRDIQIGRHQITLALREDVGPVSLYSQLLAEHIPDLTGQSVVDVGSGSGFLAIVARFQGAKRVYLLDSYDAERRTHAETMVSFATRVGAMYQPRSLRTERVSVG